MENMAGLLTDGWFYVSAAGLLVSGRLFFFLLSQYRAAAEAADRREPDAESELESGSVPEPAASPVFEAEEAPPAVASLAPEGGPEQASAAALRELQIALESLRGEIRGVAGRLESLTGRDEFLIERLDALARSVEKLQAPAAEAAPRRVRRLEPAPAPEPAVELPLAVPAEASVEVASPPASVDAPAEATPPRRGPVWPV
ncbi:MAG: hypothetical protein HY552_06975 [Elusimicrobia bacterium]|nr:hypothetical protein [Elusimicrobiota bacterium]